MELTSFLADGVLGFQVNVWFEEGLGFSPLGETGEGFVVSPSPDSDGFSSGRLPPLPLGEGIFVIANTMKLSRFLKSQRIDRDVVRNVRLIGADDSTGNLEDLILNVVEH